MKVEFNLDIYKKARDIIKRRKAIEDYIDVCVEANICPVCDHELEKVVNECQNFIGGKHRWFECPFCEWRSEAKPIY